jgi:hypothetical protein
MTCSSEGVHYIFNEIVLFGTPTVLWFEETKVTNLGNMTKILKFIISYEVLNLHAPFDGSCFGHAMSKVVQY